MGFDLKSWTQKPGKRFIFNEFGLGGGISECGDTPARNRDEAGRFSWLGGTSTFEQRINPWCGVWQRVQGRFGTGRRNAPWTRGARRRRRRRG